jgi:hypothetical protein
MQCPATITVGEGLPKSSTLGGGDVSRGEMFEMSQKRAVDPRKIEVARESLLEYLAGVEAAVSDLRTHGLGVEHASVVGRSDFIHRLQNQIVLVALSLQRLEDAARRLLKRLGADTGQFEKALRSSAPIQLTKRLANSWKHGLGGQQNNATLLNGVLVAQRADRFRDASGEECIDVLGMMVTDPAVGASPSSTLFSLVVREWGVLLKEIVPEAQSWAERLFPEPKGPRVGIPQGVKAVVPEGATVSFALPEKLRAEFAGEAKRRGARA